VTDAIKIHVTFDTVSNPFVCWQSLVVAGLQLLHGKKYWWVTHTGFTFSGLHVSLYLEGLVFSEPRDAYFFEKHLTVSNNKVFNTLREYSSDRAVVGFKYSCASFVSEVIGKQYYWPADLYAVLKGDD
jgi:hypothetical protein